jgi:hypothetical protein
VPLRVVNVTIPERLQRFILCPTEHYIVNSIETHGTRCEGGLEYLHRSPCESQEATKREPSARGYNWATLFLGDINTGTWHSRLVVSQMRQ